MTVTLAQAKDHIRVTGDEEDGVILTYMAAARAWVERYTGVMVDQREIVEQHTAFPPYFELKYGPVMAVVSIAYVDVDGTDQTVADYRVQENRIYPPVVGWPTIEDLSVIQISYDAGYDPYDDAFPIELTQAQLLLIGHWFANREAVAAKAMNEIPFAVEALAGPLRLPTLS